MGAIAALLLASAAPAPAQVVADAIYTNGVIRTMEAPDDVARAVAIRQGRILAVGAAQAVLAYRGSETRVVDLKGKTMLPGFIDDATFAKPSCLIAKTRSQCSHVLLDDLVIDELSRPAIQVMD
nr:hypothetical protein [Sphingomonas laterariae]